MSTARLLCTIWVAVLARTAGADDRTLPQPGPLPADALARLGHTRLRHADTATTVCFAPDGKTFVSGGNDGCVRVWSVATGEQVRMVQQPGTRVSTVRFTHGGKVLAVKFNDGGVRFLDPSDLYETRLESLAIGSSPFSLSADGKLFATIGEMGALVVTELQAGLPKLELTGCERFDLHPDGKEIATADADGAVTIYRLTGGKPTFTLKATAPVTALVYNPDGTRLAVGTRAADKTTTIRVFEPGREEPVAEIAGFSLPRGWIGPDLIACGSETEAGVYNLAKKEWIGRIKGVTGEFAVSPDGTKLAATGGLRVRLYDLQRGTELHAENDSFRFPKLLVGSSDGRELFLIDHLTAYHWKIGAETARTVGKLRYEPDTAAERNGTLVVATTDDVRVYAGFNPTRPLPDRPDHIFGVYAGGQAVALSPDGKRVAWANGNGKVIVTDTSGIGAKRILPATSEVHALAFNPAGDRLSVLSRDPFMRVWDVTAEPKELWKARVQRGRRGALCFSPDGKLLVAGTTAQLLVFDAHDGKNNDEPRKPLYDLDRSIDNGAIHQAAFTPDGRMLVVGTGGLYGRIEVWEVATRTLARTFTTGYGGIDRLCIFPDGSRAASAGAEEAITVWDLSYRVGKPAPTQAEIRTAVADLASGNGAIGNPAVKVLVAAGDSGTRELERALQEVLANEKKIKELIADLGSETYSVREAASRELVAQGVRAMPAVMSAVSADDPEVRDRAKELLGKLNAKGVYLPAHGLISDQLRLFRAVQALEEIGTPDAKKVLEAIAKVGGRAGAEAKSVLARLKK
jgi:WD40 repeat protein